MAGIKGRSGRRPMLEEIKRHALIKTSYEITQAYLTHKDEPLKEKAQIAVGVVKMDMSKPIVIDNSKHDHFTIDLSNLTKEQKIEIAMGRKSVRDYIQSNT